MPPYTVQYLCPRQSPLWQRGQSIYAENAFNPDDILCYTKCEVTNDERFDEVHE